MVERDEKPLAAVEKVLPVDGDASPGPFETLSVKPIRVLHLRIVSLARIDRVL